MWKFCRKLDAFKDLGILIKTKLSLSDHTAGICDKPKRISALFIGSVFNIHLSIQSLKALYGAQQLPLYGILIPFVM